jgi:hypothetical protein
MILRIPTWTWCRELLRTGYMSAGFIKREV